MMSKKTNDEIKKIYVRMNWYIKKKEKGLEGWAMQGGKD